MNEYFESYLAYKLNAEELMNEINFFLLREKIQRSSSKLVFLDDLKIYSDELDKCDLLLRYGYHIESICVIARLGCRIDRGQEKISIETEKLFLFLISKLKEFSIKEIQFECDVFHEGLLFLAKQKGFVYKKVIGDNKKRLTLTINN